MAGMDSTDDGQRSAVFKDLCVKYSHAINTIALNSTGDLLVLGGKKGLYLVNLESPKDPIKTIPQQSKWEVGCVEWNPHSTFASYVASTVNQETFIWNLEGSGTALLATIKGHQRAVTDLAWSLFEPQVLATCSIDTNVLVWDLRDPKNPTKMRTLLAHAGVTQVKWNRHDSNVLASAQGSEVRIWDLRKPKETVYSYRAHVAAINGLDWSFSNDRDLITCSQETKVKIWNTSMKNAPPVATLQTVAPVLRARYTPFGSGVVSVAQKGDLSVRLWTLTNAPNVSPVHTYNGHTDIITALDIRSKRVNDVAAFQFVTWSKDQTLRTWCVDQEALAACGYNPGSRKAVPSLREPPPPSAAQNVSISLRKSGEAVPAAPAILSPTKAQFITLEQEFQLCAANKKAGISLEKTNVVDKSCVLVVKNDAIKQSVYIKITFPSIYPMGAAPSFEFLPRTTLSSELQAQLKELLRERANKLVETNQPCLEPCIAELHEYMHEDLADLFGEVIPEPNPTAIIAENIPSPRLSAAIFSPTGQLAVFSNFAKKLPLVVRTMEDFMTHDKGELQPGPSPFFSISDIFYGGQGWNMEDNTQIGKLLRRSTRSPANGTKADQHGAIAAGRTPLRDSGDESLVLQDEDEDELAELKTPLDIRGSAGFKAPSPAATRVASPAPPPRVKRNRTVIHLRDFSQNLSISRTLASSFILQGGEAQDICTANAKLAEGAGRADLAKLWSLLALVTSPSVLRPSDDPDAQAFETPWALHPFGRGLVTSLFRHYENLRDVQTLALVSCVLSLAKPRRRMGEFEPSVSALFHISNRSMGSFGSGGNLLDRNETLLLDLAHNAQYNNYRRVYAEILYRWNEQEKSAEVGKFVEQASSEHKGIEFMVLCQSCGKPSRGHYCSNCKKYGFICSLCQLPVKGISSFCVHCGHGGHTEHMRAWFQQASVCPSGCGCRCLEKELALVAAIGPAPSTPL